MLVTSWRTLICMGFVIDIHLFFVPALIKNSAILLSENTEQYTVVMILLGAVSGTWLKWSYNYDHFTWNRVKIRICFSLGFMVIVRVSMEFKYTVFPSSRSTYHLYIKQYLKDVTSAFKGFRPHALGGFLKRCKCLLVAFDHKEQKQHDQTTRSTTVVMKFILVFVFVFSFHVLMLLAKDIPHQDDSSKVLASNPESDLSVNYRFDPQNRRLPRGWLTRVQCAYYSSFFLQSIIKWSWQLILRIF